MNDDSGHAVAAARSDRMPTLDSERIFSSYSSFLYTLTTLAAAVWIILVGGAIPAVGDTRLGIVGYACGMIVGVAAVLMSVALPAFRYGVDSIDIGKAVLGIRGSQCVLVGLLVSALGWAGVALAMVARGAGTLVARSGIAGAHISEPLVMIVAFALIALLLVLVRHGLDAIRRMNEIAGPGYVILAAISLLLLLWNVGVGPQLISTNVPADQALTSDRLKSFAYALEFGVTMAMAWWPYMGGLYRFLKLRRHAVGPIMFGGSLVGNAFAATVAALAAVHFGSADPAVWLVNLAGPVIGSIVVAIVLLLSIPAIAMLVYFVATALQQVAVLARMPWPWLVTLALAPLSLAALNTSWTLTHVITVATWGSLMFFSVTGVALVDFWVLRRGSIALEQIFVNGTSGHYWFWAGINWIAVTVIVLGIAGYLALYDPITLRAATQFRYAGAALPVMCGSAVLYYLLMRIAITVSSRGGYRRVDAGVRPAMPVEVGL